MRKLPMTGLLTAVATALAIGFVFAVAAPNAEARPQYKKAFEAKYGDKIEKVDCKICHPGESKKNRNDYGKAFGKSLASKNSKDQKKIEDALDAAGKVKSKDGKTFGELIEAGKSPAGE